MGESLSDLLERRVARWTDRIADWDAFVSDTELSADGVHPAAGHEDLMAQLIAPILTRWLEIASDGAAVSCASLAQIAAGIG